MMRIEDEYFEWMYQMVLGKGYRNLLSYLYDIPFKFILDMDYNRICDGCDLRYKFGHDTHIPSRVIDLKLDNLDCSVLEVMVALSIRMEESILCDPDYGDRTSIWFWEMIKSLGLYHMDDDNFDEQFVRDVIERFMDRDYEPNGRGGLFTVRNARCDMRDVDIWYQMCMYVDNILGL